MEIKSLIRSTYNGKKVFITGHTGFKGSWLSLWLKDSGAHIKGYALLPDKKSLYENIQKILNIKSVFADIRNYKKLEKEVLNFQPDFIFHLAAQPLVRHSYDYPIETIEVNALGTANLLQAITKLKKKCCIVVITTDKVYENNGKNYAYKETDKLGGHDPYSSSKACAEIIIQSYRLSYFHPHDIKKHKKSIASVRAGNVIGGGDYSKDRIIPDIFRALKKNKPVKIRNPRSVRPWQHVLDPLAGYLLLGAKMNSDPGKYSSAYNFGPDENDSMNVEELVKSAISFFGAGNYEIQSHKSNLHEADFLFLDSEKAKKELRWKPMFNSYEAVKQTITWYANSLKKKADKYSLCMADIKNYESLLLQ